MPKINGRGASLEVVTDEDRGEHAEAAGANVPMLLGMGGIDISTPKGLLQAVSYVKNAMAFKAQVLELAVRTATSKDIQDFQGKPWFSEESLEGILAMLGAEVRFLSGVREDDPNGSGHWGFQALAEISHPMLGKFNGLGYAHTTDAFLGTNYDSKERALERGDRSPKGRLLEEVSPHNMRQHAFTRAKGKAARNMLACGKMTWDQLEKWGFKRGEGGTVSFDKIAKRADEATLQKAVDAAGEKAGESGSAESLQDGQANAKAAAQAANGHASQSGQTAGSTTSVPPPADPRADLLARIRTAAREAKFDPGHLPRIAAKCEIHCPIEDAAIGRLEDVLKFLGDKRLTNKLLSVLIDEENAKQ